MKKIKNFLLEIFLVRGFRLYKKFYFSSLRSALIELFLYLLLFIVGFVQYDYGIGFVVVFAYFIAQVYVLDIVFDIKYRDMLNTLISSAQSDE